MNPSKRKEGCNTNRLDNTRVANALLHFRDSNLATKLGVSSIRYAPIRKSTFPPKTTHSHWKSATTSNSPQTVRKCSERSKPRLSLTSDENVKVAIKHSPDTRHTSKASNVAKLNATKSHAQNNPGTSSRKEICTDDKPTRNTGGVSSNVTARLRQAHIKKSIQLAPLLERHTEESSQLRRFDTRNIKKVTSEDMFLASTAINIKLKTENKKDQASTQTPTRQCPRQPGTEMKKRKQLGLVNTASIQSQRTSAWAKESVSIVSSTVLEDGMLPSFRTNATVATPEQSSPTKTVHPTSARPKSSFIERSGVTIPLRKVCSSHLQSSLFLRSRPSSDVASNGGTDLKISNSVQSLSFNITSANPLRPVSSFGRRSNVTLPITSNMVRPDNLSESMPDLTVTNAIHSRSAADRAVSNGANKTPLNKLKPPSNKSTRKKSAAFKPSEHVTCACCALDANAIDTAQVIPPSSRDSFQLPCVPKTSPVRTPCNVDAICVDTPMLSNRCTKICQSPRTPHTSPVSARTVYSKGKRVIRERYPDHMKRVSPNMAINSQSLASTLPRSTVQNTYIEKVVTEVSEQLEVQPLAMVEPPGRRPMVMVPHPPSAPKPHGIPTYHRQSTCVTNTTQAVMNEVEQLVTLLHASHDANIPDRSHTPQLQSNSPIQATQTTVNSPISIKTSPVQIDPLPVQLADSEGSVSGGSEIEDYFADESSSMDDFTDNGSWWDTSSLSISTDESDDEESIYQDIIYPRENPRL